MITRPVAGALRVGYSGWSYADWRGRVYPPDAQPDTWFARYAQRFDTVELNTTFYRRPDAATVQHSDRSWKRVSPRNGRPSRS